MAGQAHPVIHPLTLLRRCVVCLRLDASHRHGRRGSAHARPRTPPAALVRRAGSETRELLLLPSLRATDSCFHSAPQTSTLDVTDLGVDLGTMYYGAEVSATSTPPRMPCCARSGTSEPRSVRRDVLPRRHESWRRPPGSKDEFTSSGGAKYKFS